MADPRENMTSSPPVELGDMSTEAQEQQAGPGALQSNQDRERTAQASMAQSNTQMPSEPSLRAENHTSDRALQPISMPPPAVTRTDSEAIGPSTNLPTPMLHSSPNAFSQGPVLQFTLLLASTGTRHPYQLNERYLSKRNVKAEGEGGQFDPSTISVYTLKELILKDWRDDWDTKPSSPSAIRLIYFGQLLSDNASLKDCKFNLEGATNVVHVSVRPQEVIDDEDAGKSKASMSRDRDGSERTPGCRCVIL